MTETTETTETTATTATTAKIKFNMEELCLSFISRNRFYAILLTKLNKTPTPQVKTAGVGFSSQGKIVLYYNAAYFLDLNLAEAQAVIEHEILHVFYKHLYRLPMTKDNKELNHLQNLACDMAINQYLHDLPEGAVYPKTFDLPEEMYAEWYLEELKKKAQEQKQQSKGEKGQQGEPSDDQGEPSDDQGEPSDDQGDMGKHKTLDDHDMWGKTIDENGKVKEASESEACDIEHELDKIVRQAIKECGDKSIGDLPAGIRKELEALKNPIKKHDWKKELKIFVNTVLTLSKRLSQKRVNRRFLESVDYILPGKKKDRRPKILLARDTSGSVCNDEIQTQFLNEMINISKFCDVMVADCDAEVHQTYSVKKVEDFRKYEGGGGTAFEPIFTEAKRLAVDGIIYLTDTQGSFPKKEDIGKFAHKTIWVTIQQKEVNVPFGKHVNIEDN